MSGSKEVFRCDILMMVQSGEQVKSDRKVRDAVLPKIVLAFWQLEHCSRRLVATREFEECNSVDSDPATI